MRAPGQRAGPIRLSASRWVIPWAMSASRVCVRRTPPPTLRSTGAHLCAALGCPVPRAASPSAESPQQVFGLHRPGSGVDGTSETLSALGPPRHGTLVLELGGSRSNRHAPSQQVPLPRRATGAPSRLTEALDLPLDPRVRRRVLRATRRRFVFRDATPFARSEILARDQQPGAVHQSYLLLRAERLSAPNNPGRQCTGK